MSQPTHAEHAAQAKVATPCTAHHLTYGGRCLNCGFKPEPWRCDDCGMGYPCECRTD